MLLNFWKSVRLCLRLSVLSAGVLMDLLEFSPVIDGDFIPDEPSRLFHNAAQFDYMAGVNSMDGHIFAGVDVPSINKKNGNTTVWVLKHYMNFILKIWQFWTA